MRLLLAGVFVSLFLIPYNMMLADATYGCQISPCQTILLC